MNSKATIIDVVEGLYLAYAASGLLKSGIWDDMTVPRTVGYLARKHRVDKHVLAALLAYLACRTQLVAERRGAYVLTSHGAPQTAFLIGLYAEVYADLGRNLEALLRQPERAGACVNRTAYARTFDRASLEIEDMLCPILSELGVDHLLDIGCGVAGLLRSMATRNKDFVGWGIEHNPFSRRTADKRILESALEDRVTVYAGDGRNPSLVVPKTVRPRVKFLVASNFVNEISSRPTQVVAWLKQLSRHFPGRVLIINDYYGRLVFKPERADRFTLLHDFVQSISGQGVPPKSRSDWTRLYKAAGCRLGHVIEDTGTTRYIHFLRL